MGLPDKIDIHKPTSIYHIAAQLEPRQTAAIELPPSCVSACNLALLTTPACPTLDAPCMCSPVFAGAPICSQCWATINATLASAIGGLVSDCNQAIADYSYLSANSALPISTTPPLVTSNAPSSTIATSGVHTLVGPTTSTSGSDGRRIVDGGLYTVLFSVVWVGVCFAIGDGAYNVFL